MLLENKRSVKLNMPNGKHVDILGSVLDEMEKWKQSSRTIPESCGFILGYENSETKNITLSQITIPQKDDHRSRFFCKLKDKIHFDSLRSNRLKQNYYMGVWHTHPQNIPEPSITDWNEWKEILEREKTGSIFAFFFIVGITEIRCWVGNFQNKSIVEIFEAPKIDNIYVRE